MKGILMELFNPRLNWSKYYTPLESPIVIPSYLPDDRKRDLLTLLMGWAHYPETITIHWKEDGPKAIDGKLIVNKQLIDSTDCFVLIKFASDNEFYEALELSHEVNSKGFIYDPEYPLVIDERKWIYKLRDHLIEALHEKFQQVTNTQLTVYDLRLLRRSFCDLIDIINFFNAILDRNIDEGYAATIGAISKVISEKMKLLSDDSMYILMKLIVEHTDMDILINNLNLKDHKILENLQTAGFILIKKDIIILRFPVLRLRDQSILTRAINNLGGITRLNPETTALYNKYINVYQSDLLKNLKDLFSNEPETVILVRPPTTIKIKRELELLMGSQDKKIPDDINEFKKFILDFKAASQFKIPFLDLAIEAYYNSGCGDVQNTLRCAELAYDGNPKMKDFYHEVLAYVISFFLYTERFKEAIVYLDRFYNDGGSPSWHFLKKGLANLHLKKYKESRNLYDQALKNSVDNRDILMEGHALLYLGILDRIEGKPTEALSKYQLSESIFKNINDRYHYAMVLVNQGIVFRMAGLYPDAIEKYKEAYSIFRELGDKYRMGCVEGRLGNAYRMTNKYEEALLMYSDSISIFDYYNDYSRMGIIQKELGNTYFSMKKYDYAILFYNRAITIFQDRNNPSGVSQVINLIATAYLAQGKWDLAYENYSNSLKIFQELKDSYWEGQITANIGTYYLMQGIWEEAINNYNRALLIFNTINSYSNQGLVLGDLGVAYRMQDRIDLAIDNYNKALEISRRLNEKIRIGWLQGKLGNAYFRKNYIDLAFQSFSEALIIFRENNDIANEAWILGELGMAYCRLNYLDKAIENFEKAIKVFKKSKNYPKESWIRGELARVYRMKGSYDKAIEELNKAKDIIKSHDELKGNTLVHLAGIYVLEGKWRDAIPNYEQGLNIIRSLGDKAQEAGILKELADAHRILHEYDKSKNLLKKSLDISRDIGDKDSEAEGLIIFARLCRDQDYFGRAERYYLQAIEILENLGNKFLQSQALDGLGSIYMMHERWNDAIDAFSKAIKLDAANIYARTSNYVCYDILGISDSEKSNFRLSSEEIESLCDYDRACIESIYGEKEKAFEFLEKALEKNQVTLNWLKRDPHLYKICRDSRFKSLVKKSEKLTHDWQFSGAGGRQ